MADKRDRQNKADAGPAENKTLSPTDDAAAVATTEQGARQAAEREDLKGSDKKRQQSLAQGGYRLPDSYFQGEKDRIAHDEAIAKNQPNTRDAGAGK
jgi:hypothetical protein